MEREAQGEVKQERTVAAAGGDCRRSGPRDGVPIAGRLGDLLALRGSKPAEEPVVVIEHREPLTYMLCAAAELEHALMCEYLFAAFTLKRSIDEGLTSTQLEAVER